MVRLVWGLRPRLGLGVVVHWGWVVGEALGGAELAVVVQRMPVYDVPVATGSVWGC